MTRLLASAFRASVGIGTLPENCPTRFFTSGWRELRRGSMSSGFSPFVFHWCQSWSSWTRRASVGIRQVEGNCGSGSWASFSCSAKSERRLIRSPGPPAECPVHEARRLLCGDADRPRSTIRVAGEAEEVPQLLLRPAVHLVAVPEEGLHHRLLLVDRG